MTRIVCCGCDKEIGLAEIPFCAECVALMDPDTSRERELRSVLGPLKGAKDHIKNGDGNCVSWCPACSTANRESAP